MKKNFSYLMPDELYIDSFNEEKKISLTYNGPEYITVLIDKLTGIVSGINPETYDENVYDLIEVSAKNSPEICYFLMNSSDLHKYEYEDELMENGDIYKKIKNPTLRDAYYSSYDSESNSIKLNLIVKTHLDNVLTLELRSIQNRLKFILSNEEGKNEKGEDQEVASDLLDEILEIVENIDNCIEKNFHFMEWKYSNFENIIETFFPIPDKVKKLLQDYS
jgi:hypothetical protein